MDSSKSPKFKDVTDIFIGPLTTGLKTKIADLVKLGTYGGSTVIVKTADGSFFHTGTRNVHGRSLSKADLLRLAGIGAISRKAVLDWVQRSEVYERNRRINTDRDSFVSLAEQYGIPVGQRALAAFAKAKKGA